MATPRYSVVGSGLAGSLMAILLARQGARVQVLEGRPDPRGGAPGGGRSINLALSVRGLHALEQVGLRDVIEKQSVLMRGRMIHDLQGRLTYQPYGIHAHEAIHSVSRAALNLGLMEAAGREPGVDMLFNRKCHSVDLATGQVTVEHVDTGALSQVESDAVVGADGAFSAVRRQLMRQDRFDYSQSYLSHGYKELTIPAGAGGRFAIEAEALHIWPRGGYMMIALPNRDGSFTCTLFWPFTGPGSFASLTCEDDVERFFSRVFPDVVPLIPDLSRQYLGGVTSSLVTVRCRPWHHSHRVVLVGDACHAVVPFYGQGANAAFEDCVLLDEFMRQHEGEREKAFAAYDSHRRPQADALAELALENFVEMRDATASRFFRLGKKVERLLHRLAPKRFLPLYTMVTFTRIPYAEAVARARDQWRLMAVMAMVAGVPLMLALLWLAAWSAGLL